LPICNKCICKVSGGTLERVKINSEAQQIAQNRPEVIQKQKIAQKIAMERDPSLIIRRGKGRPKRKTQKTIAYHKKQTLLHRQRILTDPEYARKFDPKGFVSGTINGIQFQSSLELSFLLYCISENILVKRCKLAIHYKNIKGENLIYRPDFQIGDLIVEIKGWIKEDVTNKIIYAKRYCKKNFLKYSILYSQDLKKIGAIEINKNLLMKQNLIFVKNQATLRWLKKFNIDFMKVKFMT